MTKRKPKRKRKIQTYVVNASDFTVEAEDGEQFAPYEGEVVLRRDYPWRSTRLSPEMLWFDYCAEVIRILKRQIVDWTLTEDGEPLPKPGSDEFNDLLWDMDDDFRNWLQAKIADRSVLPNG